VSKEDGHDHIWNGAIDNASGVGGPAGHGSRSRQASGQAHPGLPLACGEEQGLLGSAAYVRNPAWPLDGPRPT
jgi:Zn-dependent M28 family amino/carboxypeptidase